VTETEKKYEKKNMYKEGNDSAVSLI